MTRKRFVKLVMGYEIQRNDAEKLAEDVEDYGSYEALFENEFSYLVIHKWLNDIEMRWKSFGNFLLKSGDINVWKP